MRTAAAVALALLLAAAFAAAGTLAGMPHAAPAVSVVLRADAAVDGETIRLGDVAEIGGAADPAAWAAIVVGRLAGDEPRHVTAAEVLAALRAAAPGDFSVSGGPALVRPRGETVAPDALRTALSADVSRRLAGRRFELVFTGAVPSFFHRGGSAHGGPAELRVAGCVPERPSGKTAFRVELVREGVVLLEARVTADVRVYRAVLVAARGLFAGELPAATDVHVREVLENDAPAGAVAETRDLSNRKLLRDVKAGETLVNGALEAPLWVARGERLLLVWTGDGVRVAAPAEALEAGRAGARIACRTLLGKTRVMARVTGPGEAVPVTLGE